MPATPWMPFDPAAAVRYRQQWAAVAKPGGAPITFANSIGMKMAFIPPGQDQPKPRLTLRVTRPFYIGTTELTVGQFRAFVKETSYVPSADVHGAYVEVAPGRIERRQGIGFANPGFPVTDDHPAAFVSNADAVAFCQWLSKRERRTYRLPTQVEWHWAAQAGTPAPALWDEARPLTDYAWISDNSMMKSQPVAKLAANPWGLYDLHGNLAEACSDFAREGRDLRVGVVDDPPGPAKGNAHVVVGSTYMNGGTYHVGYGSADFAFCTWGARVVCEIDDAPRLPDGPAK
jgi:formylglycine-generating enzyme required for sulfatase activity